MVHQPNEEDENAKEERISERGQYARGIDGTPTK